MTIDLWTFDIKEKVTIHRVRRQNENKWNWNHCRIVKKMYKQKKSIKNKTWSMNFHQKVNLYLWQFYCLTYFPINKFQYLPQNGNLVVFFIVVFCCRIVVGLLILLAAVFFFIYFIAWKSCSFFWSLRQNCPCVSFCSHKKSNSKTYIKMIYILFFLIFFFVLWTRSWFELVWWQNIYINIKKGWNTPFAVWLLCYFINFLFGYFYGVLLITYCNR